MEELRQAGEREAAEVEFETARRLRDAGELPSGRKVTGRADFFLGSADNPIASAPTSSSDSPRSRRTAPGLLKSLDAWDAYAESERDLEAAIKKLGHVDLVLSGRQASDTDGGQVHPEMTGSSSACLPVTGSSHLTSPS